MTFCSCLHGEQFKFLTKPNRQPNEIFCLICFLEFFTSNDECDESQTNKCSTPTKGSSANSHVQKYSNVGFKKSDLDREEKFRGLLVDSQQLSNFQLCIS